MTTQTAESLALELEEEIDGFPQATTLERKAAAMLRNQAAEIERLKYNVDTWYERFMEAAKLCHELKAIDAARAALGEKT